MKLASPYSGVGAFLSLFVSAHVFAQDATLPGKFDVSATGAANYSIPIAVPPGTANLAPALGLSYDSQSGNGLLGVGWSLEGLPSINRCPQTFAQDGVRGSVNYDVGDRFCLDGQRLIVVSGTYGADGAEYRTEIETFSKIVSRGAAGSGPAWFEVRTKSGQILQFGNSTDSRVLAQGKSVASDWMANKVSDTKGNYITVSYVNDAINGQAYPNRIDYTANDGAGLAAYNSVRFVYAARTDITPRYHAGSLSKNTVRLTNVQTYAGAALVADYQLTYTQAASTGRSLLSSISLCAAGGACLPATTNNWTSGDAVVLTAQSQVSPFGSDLFAAGWTYSWVDVSGDGRADLVMTYQSSSGDVAVRVAKSNGDGTFTSLAQVAPFGSTLFGSGWSSSWSDINGDGLADLVMTYFPGSGVVSVRVALSKGDGTMTALAQVTPFSVNSFGNSWTYVWGEVNGDGKADLMMVLKTSGGSISTQTALSNGDGTMVESPQQSPFGSASFNTSDWQRSVGDVNGDGKTDLIMTFKNSSGTIAVRAATSNGDGTMTALAQVSPFGSAQFASGWTYTWTDVNGDGKPDLVMIFQNSSGQFNMRAALSNGDGTMTALAQVSPFGANPGLTTAGWGYPAFDANGDDKADIVMTNQDSSGHLDVRVGLSNGDGTINALAQVSPFGASPAMTTPNWSYSWVDANGDGRADLAMVYKDTTGNVSVRVATSAPVPLTMQSIQDGLGANIAITYGSLSSGGALYTKGTGAVYPTVDVQDAMFVVSRVDTSNGIGGTSGTTYAYSSARGNLSGRGFLGFQKVVTTDLQSNLVETTTYRQDFPYTTLVSDEIKSINAAPLSVTTNTYAATSLGGTRNRVALSTSQISSFDLDGTVLPVTSSSYQYDLYGNATLITVATTDGHSKTTTNTYNNDATNWLLGRLSGASVQSQSSLPSSSGQACSLPWGGSVAHGQSTTAYAASYPTSGQACSALAETRTCSNGTLTGNNAFGSCGAGGNVAIASDTSNVNLFNLVGSPTAPGTWTFTVNAGVTVSSNLETDVALNTGTWPAGSTITLVNNGKIYGRGGNGGKGGGGQSNPFPGKPGIEGGAAISLSQSVSINNSNGQIFGGGGGGGGGGGVSGAGGSGGGGGQGDADSSGSSGGNGEPYDGKSGGDGIAAAPGNGGNGVKVYSPRTGALIYTGGAGGNGGTWGATGNPGSKATKAGGASGGAGGAAGKAIILNGKTVTWQGGNDAARVKGAVQ